MSAYDEFQEVKWHAFDPYDIWSSRLGVMVRRAYYSDEILGKLGAVTLALGDWLMPGVSRRIISAEPRSYPIVEAHRILQLETENRLSSDLSEALTANLASMSVDCAQKQGWAWGLGFPWMSKNGLYGPDVPFVTHTPYVMEALLVLAGKSAPRNKAIDMFQGTWWFLESLRVMHEDETTLALSYAPVKEPRMVINANSYAAFAYALHAVHGEHEIQSAALEKAGKLINWVIREQQQDGSWFYYADAKPGNFIDCFHSCFVVKNLLKTGRLLPQFAEQTDSATQQGRQYIQNTFYDDNKALCRRFSIRAHRDPFRWDLYDQAEYLGLLVDFGALERARDLVDQVENSFCQGENWFCRIDIIGRRWGKNFLRWGIVPFWYHRTRMNKALAGIK